MREEVFRRVAPVRRFTTRGGDLRVLLVDAGAKDNLVRSLLERGARVVRYRGTRRSRHASRKSTAS